VLNAFRHQRKEHALDDLQKDILKKVCSTPFGINGRNTVRRGADVIVARACSTPFGINGRNTGGPGADAVGGQGVLNAFRHQRKEHIQTGIAHA